MVRMLFDEEFVEEVYAAPRRALAGSRSDRGGTESVARRRPQSLASRPAQKKEDAEDAGRGVQVSTTIILAETRSLASLEGFFSSQFFQSLGHGARLYGTCLRGVFTRRVSEAEPGRRRRFRMSYGSRLPSPDVEERWRGKAIIAVELPATISDRAQVKLAPGYDVASFQANVIATIQRRRAVSVRTEPDARDGALRRRAEAAAAAGD